MEPALPARGCSFLLPLTLKFLPKCLFQVLCYQLLDILLVLFLGLFFGFGLVGWVGFFFAENALLWELTILTFLKEVKKGIFESPSMGGERGTCCPSTESPDGGDRFLFYWSLYFINSLRPFSR